MKNLKPWQGVVIVVVAVCAAWSFGQVVGCVRQEDAIAAARPKPDDRVAENCIAAHGIPLRHWLDNSVIDCKAMLPGAGK